MKVFLISALLVALVAAEPPAYRQRYYFAQQREETSPEASGPYAPSGWKPDGPAFNLPQRQQVVNTYEPPKNEYGPPAAPSNQYGEPPAPVNQYGPPPAPRKQTTPTKQQFGQTVSQNQYRGPQQAPQQQFGQQQFGQQQFRASQSFRGQGFQQFNAPQQQYNAPQQQYNAPQNPQQNYGPPEYTTTQIPDTTDVDEPTTVRGLTESESEPVNSVNELGDEGEVDEQQKKSGQYFVALPDGRLQRVRYVSREDVEAMKYFAKIRAENVEPLRGPIYTYAPLQKLQIAPASLDVAVAAPVPVESSKPERLTAAKLEIQPLTQVQYQLDSPGNVVPLSTSFNTYTANYQLPVPAEQRYIVSV